MKTYSYEVSNPEVTIKELIAKAAESGVTVAEDGSISGMGLKGNYKVEGNVVSITITDKPFIFPDSMIESTLNKFMGKE